MIAACEIQATVRFYIELGFDAIPLRPGTKRPAVNDWPDKLPGEQWASAPVRANVGLRCGGRRRLAVIDCDEDDRPGTVANVQQLLAGLGLGPGDYPVVQTASAIGRQMLFSLSDPPSGNVKHISSEFGAGELRYGPGSYVAAVPSVVGGRRYRLLAGDLRHLPLVSWCDLVPLAPVQDEQPLVDDIHQLPVSLLKRGLSDRCRAMLAHARDADKGQGFDKYATRSETEMALITTLALFGWTHDDVVRLFSKRQPGHFAEHARRYDYLDRSWRKALKHIASDGRRPEIAAKWAASQTWQWPNDTDRRVYMGVVAIGYQYGTWQPRAPQRDLLLYSGVGCRKTVARALDRLGEAGLIRRVDAEGERKLPFIREPDESTQWKIMQDGQHASIRLAGLPVTYGGNMSTPGQELPIEHENAMWASLGGSCWLAHRVLSLAEEPLPRSAITEAVGKSSKTVRRTLDKLQKCGFAQQARARTWSVGSKTPADVARDLAIAEVVESRRWQVERERELHRRAVDYVKSEASKFV